MAISAGHVPCMSSPQPTPTARTLTLKAYRDNDNALDALSKAMQGLVLLAGQVLEEAIR